VNTIIGIVGGPMLGLFLLGMFTQRATERGALIGCIGGLISSLVITLSKTGFSFLWFTLIGVIVTMVIGLLFSKPAAQSRS
jgi:sodium-coupled monocarboxylate transporter 8/12